MNRKEPFFSIVVPTCDRPHLLEQTLKAALNIDYPNYEIVVSDNYSTQETANIVQRLQNGKIRYFRTEKRLCMADNWQFGYEKSEGDYMIILGDDDGIVKSALRKLQQIIECTNLDLFTWRNLKYYHPDWPTSRRNSVVIGNITNSLSLISAEYLIRKAGQLKHNTRIFPHGSRFCFSRRLGNLVQDKCGRVFDIPYPDFTSSLYMLATIADSYYAYYDGAISFTTASYDSNYAAYRLPMEIRNTKRVEAYLKEHTVPLYLYVPLKSNLLWNGHAECVLRMNAHFQLPKHLFDFDYANYFILCYRHIVEGHDTDFLRTREELLDEFWRVLSTQNNDVKDQFGRFRTQYDQSKCISYVKKRVFDMTKRILKRIIVSTKIGSGRDHRCFGDEYGFSNLSELCNVLEEIIVERGIEEPFIGSSDRVLYGEQEETSW